MTAKELAERYHLTAHPENGSFLERHYENVGEGRAASGSIYYYVAEDERTAFHRIDCDEYWCYNAGSPLDVWQIDPKGGLTVTRLGTDEGCEPLLYVRTGTLFASRHGEAYADGTFLTCITVPRFRYEGFTMLSREEVLELCPAAEEFFR